MFLRQLYSSVVVRITNMGKSRDELNIFLENKSQVLIYILSPKKVRLFIIKRTSYCCSCITLFMSYMTYDILNFHLPVLIVYC